MRLHRMQRAQRRARKTTAYLLLLCAGACSVPAGERPERPEQAGAAQRSGDARADDNDAPSAAVAELRSHARALARRPENELERVVVRHVLVGVTHPRMPKVSRTPAEAEEVAARVLDAARAGQSFVALMRAYSDDSGSGVYTITVGEPFDGAYPRRTMVRGFGDVAWRLEIGEVGVALHDPDASPFGWHVIQRIE